MNLKYFIAVNKLKKTMLKDMTSYITKKNT